MSLSTELAALFRRDLSRLRRQVEGFPDDGSIWTRALGMTNSAGNLTLHLEGNLREYIGRLIGGVAYTRRRDDEFALDGVAMPELLRRIDELAELIPPIVEALSDEKLDALYAEPVIGMHPTTRHFLVHLNGHLNYHLGQIDAQRRALTGDGAIAR